MNTLDAILTRRSTRQFTDQPISQGTLHQILEAAMSGPCCVNARDWSFLVVTDREMLLKMAEANGRPADPLKKPPPEFLSAVILAVHSRLPRTIGSSTVPLPHRIFA